MFRKLAKKSCVKWRIWDFCHKNTHRNVCVELSGCRKRKKQRPITSSYFVTFLCIPVDLLTSMLTGADVRGWRYSGCSKWPLCAVNIFTIRMGSLFAWREGSEGEGQDVSLKTYDLSAPVRCESPLASAGLRSGDWLRKSGSGPPGKSFIWIGARRGTKTCN